MKIVKLETLGELKYLICRGKGILCEDFGSPITFDTERGANISLTKMGLRGRFVVKKAIIKNRVIKK